MNDAINQFRAVLVIALVAGAFVAVVHVMTRLEQIYTTLENMK